MLTTTCGHLKHRPRATGHLRAIHSNLCPPYTWGNQGPVRGRPAEDSTAKQGSQPRLSAQWPQALESLTHCARYPHECSNSIRTRRDVPAPTASCLHDTTEAHRTVVSGRASVSPQVPTCKFCCFPIPSCLCIQVSASSSPQGLPGFSHGSPSFPTARLILLARPLIASPPSTP